MSVIVEQLTKRFSASGSPAVGHVSFEAPAGAITALIGPSGAGKSTILRLVAGLETADAGVIRIEGVDVTAVPARERGIGLVFQNYALFPNLTVKRNIAFGLEIRGRPQCEIDTRVSELLHLVQLDGLGDRSPAALSGGQRQRVAFARALAVQPKVLLLDEPFGALDARVRVELREWLGRLHDETHVTTLLVTHDQGEALEVSQHVVVMLDGRVVQTGTPAQVYDHPVTPAVASFLGASLLRGHVEGNRADVGPLVVDAPGGREGQEVHAYVRPHDVTFTKATESAPAVSVGQIVRVRPVGGQVKVVLSLPSGDKITVEMPRVEFDSLGVNEGDRVLVDVRTAKVFLGDYAI